MVKLSSLINRFMEFVAMLLFLFMFVTLLYSIIGRQIAIGPTYWVEETTIISLYFLTFIGSTIAYYRLEHIRVEVIDIIVPKRFNGFLIIITHLCTLIFMIFLMYLGFQYAQVTMNAISTSLKVPKGWLHMILPICAVIMALHAISHPIKYFYQKHNDVREEG